ncbi:ParB/RepB/Spo0J family partition protein [Rhizobium johnstonii]
MTTAAQKIVLSSSRDIPFNKLVLSQSNIRRVKAGVSIEDLAASIARRGLIQSLSVVPAADADGNETGMFEVPAGGRRFRALEMLVKQKRLAKIAPVPCVVRERDSAIFAEEVSLAENIERAPLHPLDQYRAFQDMRDKGMSEEEIAAAFFVPAQVVKQRLRLASASPALLDVYAEDGMTLEQLMAFTVSNDHARQEQVWDAIKDAWLKEPYQIRRMLTETTVRASDKRAVFVGVEAYEAAGGVTMRDLFQSDDGGWLQDAGLLDRLVAEKLKATAKTIAAEGWKWIEVAVSFPYDATRGLRELQGEPLDLSAEEQATIEALNAEYQKLGAEFEGANQLPDEVDQRRGEIETALTAFETRPVRFNADDIPYAGVFISIAHDGSLDIDRGYVRAEDEAPIQPGGETGAEAGGDPAEPVAQRAVITIGGQPAEPEDDEDDGVIKPLPERLVIELTAYRTLALRNAVAQNPHVAVTALLHKLVSDTFMTRMYTGAMEAGVKHIFFPAQDDALKDSPSARALHDRHTAWAGDIPKEDDALWDWLAALDDASRMALLAHCVSYGVNALYERPNPHSAGGVSQQTLDMRLAQADRLTRATGLDLVEAGWRPTFGNYLNRVTKPRILQAVREGAGEQAAQLIDHLKKGDMAKEAERLLADTDWLPEPLRLADDARVRAAKAETSGEDESGSLPAFLASDDKEEIEADDEEHHLAEAE